MSVHTFLMPGFPEGSGDPRSLSCSVSGEMFQSKANSTHTSVGEIRDVLKAFPDSQRLPSGAVQQVSDGSCHEVPSDSC